MVTTFDLSPKHELIIERIQQFHKDSDHKMTKRAALIWALELAEDKLQREERKAKYMAEVK